ncbi:DUF4149 domain-containing protein [Simplicispira lacusdiani]|uniref:DUF4149 domain-containing protein n=1 Tax=Simplicispira lacusdiani TaxID=2213010 RepID=UPI000E73C4B7|nr:DUF4149 domain-containing protein [Simplicispira lacusdiani]
MKARLPALLAALWWGSLSAIGFMAVPLLFAHLPTPAMAGNTAAKLFAAQTWLSVACCMVLLLISRPKGDVALYPWARAATLFIVGGLLLALLVQFGVSPRIVARQDLKFWHGLGTLMYTLQWCCALATLWHTLRPAGAQPPA